MYEKGSKKESFEWYNMRKRKEKECKVVASDRTGEGSKQPTSVPKEHVANGYAKFRQNAQKNGEPQCAGAVFTVAGPLSCGILQLEIGGHLS